MPAYKYDDVSEIGIGYHTVNYKGKTKTILGVIIRGTNGTIEEWNFGRFGITKNFSIEDAKLEDEWCSQTCQATYYILTH